jgi:hypothetical protein
MLLVKPSKTAAFVTDPPRCVSSPLVFELASFDCSVPCSFYLRD